MELGVLVDRMIDPRQQAPGLESREMLLQIEPQLRRLIAPRLFCYVIHIPRPDVFERLYPPLIPAQAGIQNLLFLGPRFRGDERMGELNYTRY